MSHLDSRRVGVVQIEAAQSVVRHAYRMRVRLSIQLGGKLRQTVMTRNRIDSRGGKELQFRKTVGQATWESIEGLGWFIFTGEECEEGKVQLGSRR